MSGEADDRDALAHIRAFLRPHAAAFADKTARELSEKTEIELRASLASFHSMLRLYLADPLAFGLATVFGAMVRERLARKASCLHKAPTSFNGGSPLVGHAYCFWVNAPLLLFIMKSPIEANRVALENPLAT